GSALGECPPAPAFGRRLLLDFAQRATPPGSAYLKRVAWLLPQEAAGFELPRSVAGKGVPLTDDSKRSGGGQGHSLSRESAPPEARRTRLLRRLRILHPEHGNRPVLLQHRQPDLVDGRHAVVPHRLLQVVPGQVRLFERLLEHRAVPREDVLLALD